MVENGNAISGVQITPTLVIGLGGTGVNTVRRLKGSLDDYFKWRQLGEIPPVIRFLTVDSVPWSNPQGEPELNREDHVYIGGIPGSEVIVNSEALHPQIHEWWDQQRGAPGHISDGCKQMRDIGRLAFFYHCHEFLRQLNAHLEAIRYHQSLEETAQRGFPLRRQQLRVCIVASVAGGTGSGTFLDVAYNVRNALRGLAAVTTTIEGYLVLPQVFLPELDSVAMEASVQANGFAALSELEQLNRSPEMAKKIFHDYPNGHVINPTERPFDHTFLVGVHDQLGQGFSTPDEVYDGIAAKVFLEALYLDQAIMESAVNMHFADTDAGGDIGNTGVGRYYSSFSVNGITVRRDIPLDYCRYRLAIDVVKALVQESSPDEDAVPQLPDELSVDSLIEAITASADHLYPDPDLPDATEPESKTLLSLLDKDESILSEWLKNNERSVQDAARKKQREFREYLEGKTWDIALENGIEAVFPYLRSWHARLEEMSQEFGSKSQYHATEGEKAHRNFEHDRTELDELTLGPGMHILMWDSTAKRRHRREQLYGDARKNAQEWYGRRRKREIVRQLNSVVVHSLLGDTVQDDRGSITRMRVQWEHLRQVLESVQSDLDATLQEHQRHIVALESSQMPYTITRQISLLPAELEKLYTAIAGAFDHRELTTEIARSMRATDEGMESDDALHIRLRTILLKQGRIACLPAFADSAEGKVGRVAQAVNHVRRAFSERMSEFLVHRGISEALFLYNTPFWSYSGTINAKDVLERSNFVAVESTSPEGWQQTSPDDVVEVGRGAKLLSNGEKDTVIETGDPSLLAVYRVSYGLPLFLINEVGEMREQYRGRRGADSSHKGKGIHHSLHIWKEWNDHPPVDPMTNASGHEILATTAK